MTDATFYRMLNTLATRTRTEPTETSPGRWTPGEPATEPIRGRVRSWTTEEQVIARQDGRRVSWYFDCLPHEDVRRGDELSWTDATGEHVAVVEATRLTSSGHHLQVDLEERQTARSPT
jgi:hypothetical protein